jgi:hypothetical protein
MLNLCVAGNYRTLVLTSCQAPQSKLPYEPLGSRLMLPMEWFEQKHYQSKHISSSIGRPQSKQSPITNYRGIKNHYDQRDCVVSKFNQLSRDKN